MSRRLMFAALLAVSAACGSSGSSGGSPTGPSTSGGLSAPSNFRIVLQRVNFTSNEIQLSWSGSTSTYHLTAGTTSGGSDKLSVDVSGQNYTWTAPREEAIYYVKVAAVSGGTTGPASIELPVFTMDLRNAIDALYFGAGPMADTPSNAQSNPFAAIWPDGTVLRIQVSAEAGEANRAAAQAFADDYANVTGGAVRATSEIVADDFHTTSPFALPAFTIGVRVLQVCPQTNVLACANYGPAPVGPNASFVNMNGPGGTAAVAHELGHSYGMSHVRVNSSVRPELNFLMNPVLLSSALTDPEKNAIAAARSGGLRPGMRRNDALMLGLVLPYTGSMSIFRR
jgi:hypothetical protein